MRLDISLLAVASLVAALPAVPLAQGAPPPPRAAAPAPSAPPPSAYSHSAPPPPSAAYPRGPPAYSGPRAPYPRAPGPYPSVPAPGHYGPTPYHYAPHYYPPYHYSPFYWSFGWSFGWYPLYPAYPAYAYPVAPPPDGAPLAPGQMAPVPPQERIYTRFSLYGAGRHDGYIAGLTFDLDSRLIGFNADIGALAWEPVTGPLHSSASDPVTLANAHVTWTFLLQRSVRLRLETGVSMLDLPDSAPLFDRPWRGNTLFGPDVGVSGHLGLVGPVGLEGHARITPYPQRIIDTFAGLTVHGGPVGVNAGWRWVDIAGDGIDAPKMMFRGPQFGLVLAF